VTTILVWPGGVARPGIGNDLGALRLNPRPVKYPET